MITSLVRLTFAGMLLTAVPSFATTLYVDVNSTNPVSPYTNWATAASVIQDAVDAATNDDTVLVTNGVYDTGKVVAWGTNRVVVNKPLTLRSVNGPEFTVIKGAHAAEDASSDGSIRCVWLVPGALLSGFTLTNGEAITGGGVGSSGFSTVTNCVVAGNSAARWGGGVYGINFLTVVDSTLRGNMAGERGGGVASAWVRGGVVTGNSSGQLGGGASSSRLTACVVAGNSAGWASGGVVNCSLTNSVVYYNTAPSDPNGAALTTHTCTTPLPTSGSGNITNAPLFVDTNNWSNLRLQSNSPCINAGNNAYVTTTNDLDGNPRIQGGTVDMGAYEFQSPQSSISYAWLQHYGLPTDESVDDLDVDGDKATTWQEWKMWTNPTNELSVLRLLNPESQANGTQVSWQSVGGHSYTVERGTNPATGFTPIKSNILGQAGTTSFTDTTATNGKAFYRIGVAE